MSKLTQLKKSLEATVVLPHVQVQALAGCGKSAVLVDLALNALRNQPFPFSPSGEQQDIINAICGEGYEPKSIMMVAFNKSIQLELEKRTPGDVYCKTMHSLGLSIIKENMELIRGRRAINNYKVDNLIGEVLKKDCKEVKKNNPLDFLAIKDLVGFVKVKLLPEDSWDYDNLSDLCAEYGIKWQDETFVFDTTKEVLRHTLDGMEEHRYVDFNDMLWIPVMKQMPCYKYDLLMVDEVQDLNPLQQQLCLMSGKRIVIVGDENQAIYNFAGADAAAMSSFSGKLNGEVVTLPLNATRRCGWEIIREAQKIVPHFTGSDSVPEGKVSKLSIEDYHDVVEGGDMVLCRTNAPLVSQCLKFLNSGKKAQIIGRDFGSQLAKIVKKNYADDASEFMDNMDQWKQKELEAPKLTESNKILRCDQHECLTGMAREVECIEDLIPNLKKVFTDDEDGKAIRLSTIHKSKGLEADNVFFLIPEYAPCPHPMAKSDVAKQQEQNLKYIGITRAIHNLYWIY